MSHPEAASILPRKVIVPIDFSASSHQALEAATELAEKLGATICLLHVIPENSAVALPQGVTAASIVKAAQDTAAKAFETSLAALKAKGIRADAHIEVGEDVAGTILEVLDREQADLLVLTTHGLSGWYPQVFGSIAEKLVKLAPCPLFLLRTPKPESSAKVVGGRMMEWW